MEDKAYNLRNRSTTTNNNQDAVSNTVHSSQATLTNETHSNTLVTIDTTNNVETSNNYHHILFGEIPESVLFHGLEIDRNSLETDVIEVNDSVGSNPKIKMADLDLQTEKGSMTSLDKMCTTPSDQNNETADLQLNEPNKTGSLTNPMNESHQPIGNTNDSNILTQITYLFRELKQDINLVNQNMNTIKQDSDIRLNDLKNELNQNISLMRDDLQKDIKSIENNVNAISNEITNLKSDVQTVKSEIEAIHNTLSEHSLKINTIEMNVDKKIEIKSQEIRNELNTKIETNQITIDQNIATLSNNLTRNFDSKLQQQINICQSNLKQQNDDLVTKIEGQNENLVKLNSITDNHSYRINNMEQQISKSTSTITPLYVTCPGTNRNYLDINPPKFHGKTQNPKEFLSKLKRFYERNVDNQKSNDESEHLLDVIEQCLDHHASKWFELVKYQIKNWTDFEAMFLNKYWSHEVQRGIKQRIDVEKYRQDGRLSRAEYFIEKVLTLRSITPPLTDEEIVIILSDHFSELVQDARRIQNVTTVHEFELLLQREDLKDAHQRTMTSKSSRYEPSHPRTHNYSNQQGNRNHYQPTNRQPNSPPRPNQQYNHGSYNQSSRGYSQPQNYSSGQQNIYRKDYNSRGRGNYNSQRPNYNTNPPHREERQYPSQEQSQVCSAIIDKSNPTTGTTNYINPNHQALN